MLSGLKLDQSVGRGAYKEAAEPLKIELQRLHREIFEAKIPVLMIFDGWDGAGKGDCINLLLERMDPRGTRVHPFQEPNEEEAFRPFFWRFMNQLPSRGQVSVFEQSWYHWLLDARTEGRLKKGPWKDAARAVNETEQLLANDGTLILKFWIHIGKKEQKKRFKKWEKDSAFRFRVDQAAWRQNKRYDERLKAAEELLAATHSKAFPWTVIDGSERRYRRLRILEEVCSAFRRALSAKKHHAQAPRPAPGAANGAPSLRVTKGPSPLDKLDLSVKLQEGLYRDEIDELSGELRVLQHLCYQNRLPVVLVFEGADAAGKGGAIRRLASPLDPRGYTVVPVAAPEGEEKQKHYLWRFWRRVPKAGHWTVFDRSWYGRVLVERVEGFAPPEDWKRAYGEIRDFEAQLGKWGAVVVKFWLQIGQDEQLRRFKEREAIDYKNYKITAEDWRNREKWPQYKDAIADMLIETSTAQAPWTLIEAEDKLWARAKVLRTVAKAVREALKTGRDPASLP